MKRNREGILFDLLYLGIKYTTRNDRRSVRSSFAIGMYCAERLKL